MDPPSGRTCEFSRDKAGQRPERDNEDVSGITRVPREEDRGPGPHDGAGNGVGPPHAPHGKNREPDEFQDDADRNAGDEITENDAHQGARDDGLGEEPLPPGAFVDGENARDQGEKYDLFEMEGDAHVI